MNSFLQIAFASALALLTGTAAGKSRHDGLGAERVVSVHLFDRAEVPARELQRAILEANRLFLAAGIKMIWEQPLIEAPDDGGIDMSVPGIQMDDDRSYVVVRVLRGMPATALPGVLGFALPFARTGAKVTIFYDRIEALARSPCAPGYVILGHMMAHEIGHVLLGSTEHSAGGVMRARWTSESWRLASMGLLAFRRTEKEQMGTRLERLRASRLTARQ